MLHGIVLIYLAYGVGQFAGRFSYARYGRRRPSTELVSSTLVGFTGLALLGRAGEFIRPYLIARRTEFPFSSQLAVWAVERIFDIGAFAVLMALAIFLPSALQSIPHPEYYQRFREAGFILIAIVAGTAVAAVFIGRNGEAVARWVEQRFSHLSSNLGHRLAQKVREFGMGLNTIHGPVSFSGAERGLGGNVVHDRAGVPRSDAFLRSGRARDSGVTAVDFDFRQHAGIDAAVTGGGWRIANGDDCDALERI